MKLIKKIKKYVAAAVAVFPFCLSPSYSYAQDSIDQLLNLSIEDLMKVSVSTASKKIEPISDAPGIINVITAQDIKDYGAVTLSDILNRLPEVYHLSGEVFREQLVAIRGQGNGTSPHVLFLLNGRPIREGYSGAGISQVIRSFPLDAIEKIEVIRGPGSVLYGTNAFSGVINIISKRGNTNQPITSASLSYGANNTLQSNTSIGKKGSDYQFFGSFNAINTDGWKGRGFDAAGVLSEADFGHDSYGLTLNGDYKNFTINTLMSRTKEDTFDLPFRWSSFGTSSRDMNMIDLGYTFNLNNNWDLKVNGAYTAYDFNYAQTFSVQEHDLLAEATLTGNISDKIRMVTGAIYNELRGSSVSTNFLGTETEKHQQSIYSAYSQFDYQAFDKLKFIGGLQLNKSENLKPDLSPRAGAVFKLNDSWGGKLLYGKAYRSPYILENGVMLTGVLAPNPDLKPEKISTYDLQFFYNDETKYAAITGFYSRIQDALRFSPTLPLTPFNGSKVTSSGATIEGKYIFSPRLKVEGSASYSMTETTDGSHNFYSAPNKMVKIGSVYTPNDFIRTGLFITQIGQRQIRDLVVGRNPEPGDFTRVTANINVDLNRALNLKNSPNMSFSLFGDNLLDEDIRLVDEESINSKNSFPAGSGRAFYGTLKITF